MDGYLDYKFISWEFTIFAYLIMFVSHNKQQTILAIQFISDCLIMNWVNYSNYSLILLINVLSNLVTVAILDSCCLSKTTVATMSTLQRAATWDRGLTSPVKGSSWWSATLLTHYRSPPNRAQPTQNHHQYPTNQKTPYFKQSQEVSWEKNGKKLLPCHLKHGPRLLHWAPDFHTRLGSPREGPRGPPRC